MSDERPQPDSPDVPGTSDLRASDLPAPAAGEAVTAGGAAVTASGYSYELVGEPQRAREPKAVTEPEPGGERARRPWPVVLIAAGVALLAVVATWLVMTLLFEDGDGDDGDARASANVANIINAFSQGQGTGSIERFEGELPPGFPADVPAYPDGEVVSSLVQVGGDDVVFLAVYDTPDSRDDVAAYYKDELNSGDFQLDGVQDGREAALLQFSKTDDADVSGLVLVSESKEQDLTTIFYSVEVISGADDVELSPFVPRVSRPLPATYPSEVPQYPDGVVVETVTQREPQGDIFGVAFITRDSTASVLDFYSAAFEEMGWTVSDADASQSELEDAEGINFESDDGEMSGSVIAGVFQDDRNYTRTEMQVRVAR